MAAPDVMRCLLARESGVGVGSRSWVGSPTPDPRLPTKPLRHIHLPRHPLPGDRAAAFVADAEVAANVGHLDASGAFVADDDVVLDVADVDPAAAVFDDLHAAGTVDGNAAGTVDDPDVAGHVFDGHV